VRQIHRAGFVAAFITSTMIASTVAANATGAVRATAPGPVSVGSAPVVPFGAHLQSAAPADQQLAFDVVLRPRDSIFVGRVIGQSDRRSGKNHFRPRSKVLSNST